MKMDYRHNKDIDKLISQCCNYDNGNCIALDCKCIMTGCKTSILCKWFMKYVLPVDKVLYEELKAFNMVEDASFYTKNCKSCGDNFKATSKTSQYCDKCRVKRAKSRYKKYNSKRG